ncbi:ommochrome-binding protein-like isoform X2 [Manduca sexta]|nr:ommochrome-binding protein-like isoform X2 [Manduca sexta]XP_030030312.2 ommochrome-binding protein-like isoform X2 [Manduca sexta]XP_030030314.2 ommochrome-binding protein-like isoform X2 [Manduca sexta]XP_037292188.1 ommochrome-binding protein-like isoform X2 [Manduca sexta]
MMMILLALLAVASAARIEIEVAAECASCVLFDKICYNVTHLLDLQAPFRNKIVIHKIDLLRYENRLFYSFEPTIDDEEYYKIGFVNLDDQNISGVINGVPKLVVNIGTFAIDQENRRVYLGGDGGIVLLDAKTNIVVPYSSLGDDIRSLFYKHYVYFVRFDDRGVIVKKGDYFKTLLEYMPVKTFVVNKNDVIVFLNSYGLYVGKDAITHRLSINAFFRGLTIDLDGEVYTWWIDGIYRVVIDKNLYRSKIVKVAHLTSIGAMTFDNENNIIFTMDKSVYRLTETKYNCTII